MSADPPHRVAVLTPPGAGAIGLIRVSGDDPAALVNTLFRPRQGPPPSHDSPNRLRYGRIVEDEETLDDVVVVAHTVNGHRCVDITAHGGVRVIERIVAALCERGATWCRTNDAWDRTWPAAHLLDVEILQAMTEARSERALRFLAYQRVQLPALLASIAESIPVDVGSARSKMKSLLSGFRAADALLRGITVALVGPPNSGKSTLFNHLLGRSAAMVSDTAGTTRDWIAEPILLHGVSVTLVDTAGRHEAGSALEVLAIEAGRNMADRADLRVLVLDGSAAWMDATGLREQFRAEVVVFNKTDVRDATAANDSGLAISATTGLGLDDLIHRILDPFGIGPAVDPVPTLVTQSQIDWAGTVLSALDSAPETAGILIRDRLRPRAT